MAAKTTMQVPHLGVTAGYRLSGPSTGGAVDPSKPTVVLVNSMCTTSSLYEHQFGNAELTTAVNLLAVEPLGHGATSCPAEHFTYWDSAIVALQVMDKLGVDKAFALGTSQGGWIVVRMALLAPERILGVLPLGTSMDYESEDSRSKGAWDPKTQLMPFFDAWSNPSAPSPEEFGPGDIWCGMVGSLGFSGTVPPETLTFWAETVKSVYSGEAGRKKLKGALVNLLSRDGLLMRLRDVKCPVYWLQGTQDPVFGVKIPEEQIKLFASSPEATFTLVEGGGHYLNATSPKEVDGAILQMVKKYA